MRVSSVARLMSSRAARCFMRFLVDAPTRRLSWTTRSCLATTVSLFVPRPFFRSRRFADLLGLADPFVQLADVEIAHVFASFARAAFACFAFACICACTFANSASIRRST